MPYTQKVADTLEKVVNSVNAAMPGIVEQIILYGSYARGDYSPESDLDIMLLMNCSHADIKNFQKAYAKSPVGSAWRTILKCPSRYRIRKPLKGGLRFCHFIEM